MCPGRKDPGVVCRVVVPCWETVEATASYEWFVQRVEPFADRFVLDQFIEEWHQHAERQRAVDARLREFARKTPIAEAVLETIPTIGPVTIDVVAGELIADPPELASQGPRFDSCQHNDLRRSFRNWLILRLVVATPDAEGWSHGGRPCRFVGQVVRRSQARDALGFSAGGLSFAGELRQLRAFVGVRPRWLAVALRLGTRIA